MAKINKKGSDRRFDLEGERLAGGFGVIAAAQSPEDLLRRSVMANLLWEDLAYETGDQNAKQIESLIPKCDPEVVAHIAIETRAKQKLRHIPLFLAIQMLKYNPTKRFVRQVIGNVVTRPDQATDLVALYLKERGKKGRGAAKIPRQMKLGLADAFGRFDAYQLAKYNREGEVKLRDVLRLIHAKPSTQEQSRLWKQLLDGTLAPPKTWEVELSKGEGKKSETDKKLVWEEMLRSKKMGALALLRNLRNFKDSGVDSALVRAALKEAKSKMLLPLNFLAAVKHAPHLVTEIEEMMLRIYSGLEKLQGHSVLVVDVSGSMQAKVSGKSEFSRMECAAAMAILARETCERVSIYATAGSDGSRIHTTALIPAFRGFGLMDKILKGDVAKTGGGIFTRQALEYIYSDLRGEKVDRIMVFSDSQDCDTPTKRVPKPFGTNNYIIDVSAHKRGVNYEGVWTAEISGWSEHFLDYVRALEGLNLQEQETEDQ